MGSTAAEVEKNNQNVFIALKNKFTHEVLPLNGIFMRIDLMIN